MTSKAQLAEQILRAMAGGSPPSDFPVKAAEIILLLPTFFHKLVEASYNQTKDVDTRWLTTFDNVPIIEDEAKELMYSVLPAQYLELPNYAGLYHVGPQKDQSTKFKLVKPSFLAMYKGLEAQQLHGYVGFWIEGNRIYYTNDFSGVDYKCESVLMKMVCSLDAYGDYDEIFISEQAKFDVIASMIAYYKSELTLPGDRITDNRFLINPQEIPQQ